MNRALETEPPDAQKSHRHGDGADLLTQVQVCRYLGICVSTWRNWRQSGDTPAPSGLPGRLRWRRADVDALRDRQRQDVA